jgi:hypothetical protein
MRSTVTEKVRAASVWMEETEAVSELLARRKKGITVNLLRTAEIVSGAPPCFNWPACGARAALEKVGRSLCRSCARYVSGAEYPLRDPSPFPLYKSGGDCALAMDTDGGA